MYESLSVLAVILEEKTVQGNKKRIIIQHF
jgi:hypothetical protein